MGEISPVMPLGEQLSHLAIIATASAWIAWMWTHEEIFKDIQHFLTRTMKHHHACLKRDVKSYNLARWEAREARKKAKAAKNNNNPAPPPSKDKEPPPPDIWHVLRHWAIYKACFGLTCQTCVVHYPALLFITAGHYRILDPGWMGFIYAWMTAAFAGDGFLWTLEVMKKFVQIEDKGAKAVEYGTRLLQLKVEGNNSNGHTTTTVSMPMQRQSMPNLGDNPMPLPGQGTGAFNG
jgi:hypothetical protein